MLPNWHAEKENKGSVARGEQRETSFRLRENRSGGEKSDSSRVARNLKASEGEMYDQSPEYMASEFAMFTCRGRQE